MGPPAAGVTGVRRGTEQPGVTEQPVARRPARLSPGPARHDANPGWAIISYLISGMAVYGGIGWLVGRWTGYSAVLFPVGLLVGLGLTLALVIFRYGRS